MAYIKIENLTFSYNGSERKALNNVRIEIEKGDFTVVCGSSGSGKSTLLRMLKKQLIPKGNLTGKAMLNSVEISNIPELESVSKIGYVMQNPDAQIVTDKVWHELAFGLENLGCSKDIIRLRVSEVSQFFGITDWYHKSTNDLSGGQKQLLNLASVMAMTPDVILLDEPTSQLDPIASIEFLDSIKRINNELGVTVIMTSHNLEDVYGMATSIVVMEDGVSQSIGTPISVASDMESMKDHPVYEGLPTSVRMFHGLAKGGICPLNVKEAREYLSDKITCFDSRLVEVEEKLEKPNDDVVKISNCYFKYSRTGKDVLRGASISVQRGKITAIVGGNGAGKSTLLNVIAGVSKPYAGTILIDGKNIKSYKGNSLYRGLVAMLPQDPTLLFSRGSVREEIMSMKALSGECCVMSDEALTAMLDLDKIMDLHPYDISGGEAQKVAFAKVLKTDPSILLLDEPTKGLDPLAKKVLAELLLLLKSQGKTIIIVSHDIEFCSIYADRCSMFFDGGIVAEGNSSDFFSGNRYYTTASARIAKGYFEGVVTTNQLIAMAKHCL